MRRGPARNFTDQGSPSLAAPVQALRRRLVGHAFPPDAALRRERNVGEDCVPGQRRHRIGIGLGARPRRNAKEASLGIDGAQFARCVRLDPRDVVAHGPDLPAIEALGWNQHGKIRLAAGGREGRSNVGLLLLSVLVRRALHTEDEHVLGHPALVASDVRSDAQRETLFPEQCIAAVTGAVAPDLARLGKMHDVLGVVTRPRDILLPRRQRSADRVHAGHNAFGVLVNLGKDRSPDPRHDAHIHDGVGRVGQLHANLRHRRADRPHRIGQHVHRPSAHGAAEESLQLLAHHIRIFPVVGRAGVVFREGADEGPVLDPCNIIGRGTGIEATWPELFIQPKKGACIDQLLAKHLVLSVAAVDPMNMIRLRQVSHLFDPADEVLIGCWRRYNGVAGHRLELPQRIKIPRTAQ